MTAARAFIAIPLLPTDTWRLLRDRDALPDGYTIIGSIEVGRADLHKLNVEPAAKRLRATFLDQLKANGVSLDAWRELFALYVRMNVMQRRQVIEYAERLLEVEASARCGELLESDSPEITGA